MGRADEFHSTRFDSPRPIRWRPSTTPSASGWTDGYNRRPHDALDGRTPQEVFTADTQPLAPVDQQALHDAFLREETRKVDKTGCVKFRGALVEIGAPYAGNASSCATRSCLMARMTLTAFDGDRLIGPVNPLEWNRPFDPQEHPDHVDPSDPFADHPTPTRSRYLDALDAEGRDTPQGAGRHSLSPVGGVRAMYEAFFQLTATPFTRGLAPEQLLSTPAMEEAGARLDYAARERRFAVLTGAVGAGKSTALRAFLARLPATRYTPLYVTDSQLTPRNFYYEALWQLGLPPRFYRGDARRQLHRALQERDDAGKQPVIVIDEAHLLGRDMLEEVRFLLNFDVDSRAPLALILAGQPELRTHPEAGVLRRHRPARQSPRPSARPHPGGERPLYPTSSRPGRRRRTARYRTGAPPHPRLCRRHPAPTQQRLRRLPAAAYGQQRQLIDDAIANEVIDTEFA